MGRRRFTLRAGHRVLITGAASGLGRALAVAAARRGARLVLTDIQAMQDTLAAVGVAEAHPVTCDVADPQAVGAMVREAYTRLGGLDLVLNNAGVAASGPLEACALDDWEWLRQIDLDGVLYVARAVIPALQESGGWLVNTASLAAIAQAPHMSYYNVCKAGVLALSETLYSELAPAGVGVSALCPGFFQTGLTRTLRATHPDQLAFVEKVMSKARLTADGVAELTFREIAKGRLYIIPSGTARTTWYLSRLAPQWSRDLIARGFEKAIARGVDRSGASRGAKTPAANETG